MITTPSLPILEIEPPRPARDPRINALQTQSNDEEQDRILRHAILSDCLKFKEGYDQAGDLCDCFVDLRNILHRMPFLHIAARLLWRRIRKYQPHLLGGMSTAADPLVFALLYEAYAAGCDVAGFTMRSQPKTTGLRKIVEGAQITEGSRVVIVDDLLNSGSTIVKCATHAREQGADVVAVGVVFDFENVGREKVLELGVPLEYLTTSSEIGITATASNLTPGLSWTFAPLNRTSRQNFEASPRVRNGAIFVGSDEGIFALNDEGAQYWRLLLRSPGGVARSPLPLNNGLLYFGATDGQLYCVDQSSGKTIWQQSIGDSDATEASCSEAEDLIFAIGNNRDQTSSCVAMNPTTGESAWETILSASCHLSGLAVSEDRVITSVDPGCLSALESKTGRVCWSLTTDGPIHGYLVAEDDLCFFGTLNGWCQAVDVRSGILRWKRHLADQLFVCPAVHGNNVLVPGATHLVAMRTDTGEVVWIAPTPARMMGVVIDEASHTCIGGSEAGYVCAYDLDTGKQRWRIRLGTPIRSVPAVSGSICAVAGGDTLFGIDLASPQQAQRKFGMPALSTTTILSL